MPDFLDDGPPGSSATVLLAHGAGAPMDSAAMSALAGALAGAGLQVLRFEFGYMAGRREGRRRPPPKAETLVQECRDAVDAARAILHPGSHLVIGGKSMGGRVASMAADELHSKGRIGGLLCLGYPFHPPCKPQQLRTAHLRGLRTPTLICQGTRDEFGTREEVASYDLADTIEFLWLEDGDHDLKPRKAISGFSVADHLRTLAQAVTAWTARILPPTR